MLPLPRLPAVAALDSALFIGTNWVDLTDGGATTLHKHDHGGMDGLADDDHTGYARLGGRAGGQSWTAGTDAGDDLTLSSTVHATKGNIHLGALSTFDEVNNRLGIGTLTPGSVVEAYYDGVMPAGMAHFKAVNNAGQASLGFDSYNASTYTCSIFGRRMRGTVAAPRRTKSGDAMFRVGGSGGWAADDATDATLLGAFKAQMEVRADEDWVSGQYGTKIVFGCTTRGATTLADNVVIGSGGHLIIPELTTNPNTTDLSADGPVAIYAKGDVLVFAYNNGGTITYIKLSLD